MKELFNIIGDDILPKKEGKTKDAMMSILLKEKNSYHSIGDSVKIEYEIFLKWYFENSCMPLIYPSLLSPLSFPSFSSSTLPYLSLNDLFNGEDCENDNFLKKKNLSKFHDFRNCPYCLGRLDVIYTCEDANSSNPKFLKYNKEIYKGGRNNFIPSKSPDEINKDKLLDNWWIPDFLQNLRYYFHPFFYKSRSWKENEEKQQNKESLKKFKSNILNVVQNIEFLIEKKKTEA
jgi:hypothetical protein